MPTMSEPNFIFVSSVFPRNFALKSASGQDSGESAALLTGDELLHGLRWLNPGFGERFMQANKIDDANLFTPSGYPLGEKDSEAFFRSLESMNGDSALDVKTMWAQEIARQADAQTQARSEKAALGRFVDAGGAQDTGAESMGREQALADDKSAALAKAQQFLLMAFFLEKTQADIQTIMGHLTSSRQKMDEALGFLEDLSKSPDKNVRDQAEHGLDELHALTPSLPDAQDFYGLIGDAAGAGLNKPDWRFLLSSVAAFAPLDAVFVAQSKELEQDLKERGLWDAPEAQFVSGDATRSDAGNAGLVLESLKDLQQKGFSLKALNISLAEMLGIEQQDAARPWLHNKRVMIIFEEN